MSALRKSVLLFNTTQVALHRLLQKIYKLLASHQAIVWSTQQEGGSRLGFNLKPDFAPWLASLYLVSIIELTVSWEDAQGGLQVQEIEVC